MVTSSPWDVAAERLAPTTDYLHAPEVWVRDKLQEHLWTKQIEIAQSVVANRLTAVPSCHGAGKSFIASRIACWWLDAHVPGSAFVVSTAPSFPQVRAILWREINRAHAKGHLIGQTNQTEWWIGKELVAFGRKPADYSPQAFQGIHQQYVLIIIDEAGGVPRTIWDAVSTLTTNNDSRILAIGNPDDPVSTFADNCKPGSGYNVIKIPVWITPNFSGEPVPDDVGRQLVDKVWVEEREREWGKESPLWQAKIEAEFPDITNDAVVPWIWATACRTEWYVPPKDPQGSAAVRHELGLDVGAGGDLTVLRERIGPLAAREWTENTRDPMKVAGLAIDKIRETGASRIKIDTIGWGWGVGGRIAEVVGEQGIPCEVIGVNVSEKASEPNRFINLRAQMWWEIGRELSRTKGWDLSRAGDATLAQLVAPKYTYDSAGRIKVEPKDDTRLRLGRSPDNADALLLAFYEPPALNWEMF